MSETPPTINRRKALEFNVNHKLSPLQRELYIDARLQEQIRVRKESGNIKPAKISLEKEEDLYEIASKISDERARRLINDWVNKSKHKSIVPDPFKMDKDWERAHSDKGRPPIGGAQDN